MSGFDVDPELVRALARLLRETGLGEIEYEADGRRIRVAVPGGGAAWGPGGNPGGGAPAGSAPQLPAGGATHETQQGAAAPSPGARDADNTHPGTLTSPMVGTIYLSPTPEEPPFVSPGEAVEAGQTIMLVEAMKTFNEVKAPHGGRVTSILVDNGQPVEYGEPLAVID